MVIVVANILSLFVAQTSS